jgi:hypothetical protein
MTTHFADPVRQAVGAALGLEPAAVLTACTHTHSGPNAMAGGERIGWPTPEGYRELLVAGCVAAAEAAAAAVEPAALRFARAPLPAGLSYNRRDLPHDPSFAVLDVLRPDGSRIGTIANVAIHPVALGPGNLAVSADWPGVFRDALERTAGGTAVLLSGPLGDVNPEQPHIHPQEMWGSFDDAAEVGRGVADAVSELLAGADSAGGDAVGVASARRLDLPVDDTMFAKMNRVRVSSPRDAGSVPSGLESGYSGQPTVPVELVEWHLGAVDLVSVPGEAFTAFGRSLVESRPNPSLSAGLSPVWQGYLPDPFREGYEEGLSYGASFVRALLDALTAPEGP